MDHATANISRLDGLRIALVFPHFVSDELASYADNGRFMGTVQPLSLLYVAAVLRNAGAQVMVVDCPARAKGPRASIKSRADMDG